MAYDPAIRTYQDYVGLTGIAGNQQVSLRENTYQIVFKNGSPEVVKAVGFNTSHGRYIEFSGKHGQVALFELEYIKSVRLVEDVS